MVGSGMRGDLLELRVSGVKLVTAADHTMAELDKAD